MQHGPAEAGFPALSDALVNIRATLSAACSAGVIGPDDEARLIRAAQAVFFKQRSWERILDGDPAAAALRPFLSAHAIDIKQADARALVAAILAHDGTPPPPPDVPDTFLLQALLTRLRA